MLTDKQIQMVLDAERKLWSIPEPGYREVKSTAYLSEKFKELGYEITYPDNITGFSAEFDTGIEGPTVAVIAELDSLISTNHPEADPETKAVHSCGHHIQGALMLGVAAAIKNEGAADGLCGKVRFIAVPSEEGIEPEFRQQLFDDGVIHSFSGKMEFVYRGMFDGVDLALHVHAANLGGKKALYLDHGFNGCVVKKAIFKGKAAHAGGSPHHGVNALYAATCAINAANALRETFIDSGKVRFHPIITEGGTVVNTVPDKVVVLSYVRGATEKTIRKYNQKINRAFACSAAAMGAEVTLIDRMGYYPLDNCKELVDVIAESMREIAGEDSVILYDDRDSGCTDLGDLSTIMPVVTCMADGATGACHADNFRIIDPTAACVNTAECLLVAIRKLLSNDGERAKEIKANYKPLFASKEEYFASAQNYRMNLDTVTVTEDGQINIKYMN